MSYTPGPWTYVAGTKGIWPHVRLVRLGSEKLGAVLVRSSNADARLIAAAPELLEALEDALALVAEAQSGVSIRRTMDWEERARAAIAKAKGTNRE